METALAGLEAQVEPDSLLFPPIQLPLLVFAALRGDYEPAVPLAAATTLLFLGIDIFDDLADGDRPSHWDGTPVSQISLAAATLFSSLPQLAISELNAPPSTLAAIQRTLAEGLLRMSAGQQGDLSMAGTPAMVAEEVESSVAAKSGEELAIFASLAAQLAGASSGLVDLYARLGRALGTAGQLASDCHDLFTAAHSRDLANGSRTLPIALYLATLYGEEREAFLCLLEAAKGDATAQAEVRRRLREAGVLRHCAFIVEVYCQRALKLLDRTCPLEPGAGGLLAMIDSISFFPKGGSNEQRCSRVPD